MDEREYSTTASNFTLDSSGNVYVVGGTSDATYSDTGVPTYEPSTFPTTPGAYNTNHMATVRYFLLKLNLNGSALDYSTFLSDQPNISGEAVVVGVAGNAFVTGTYNQAGGKTTPFPCTSGAFQCTYGGDSDGFVMKFNGDASQLLYATLIGGAKADRPSQILVDSSGQATIAGWTYSPSFPITPNGKRQTDEGGFVTTFNTTGTALLYSTVLNQVFRINVKRDTAGNYYVGGSAGTNLPTTANAYPKSSTATGTDIHVGFLTVMNSAGNPVYSSYVGGNPPGIHFKANTQVRNCPAGIASHARIYGTGCKCLYRECFQHRQATYVVTGNARHGDPGMGQLRARVQGAGDDHSAVEERQQ